jgi:hypothetical protein
MSSGKRAPRSSRAEPSAPETTSAAKTGAPEAGAAEAGSLEAASLKTAPLLRLAAAAEAAEAVLLCVAVVLNVIDVASGRTATRSNAAGFIALEVIVAIGVAAVAAGLAGVRPWSRTPAALTQLFTVVIAGYLLGSHDYGWGIPALVIALAGFAGIFAPASLRALNRRP